MLDVHPPHEKVHSWTQFLIHIAAIAIELLIAIGLEQTVEYFHHRHQLKEAREELSAEFDEHRRILRQNLQAVKTIQSQLDHNMALQREQQTSHDPVADKLDYAYNLYPTP